MSELPRVLCIANPHARGGATGEKLPEIERALRRQGLRYELVATRGPGHATEIARAARARAFDVIAVAGGDGTINEVASAYLDDAGEPIAGADLAIIPSGGDFRKTLGFSGSIEEAAAQIRFGRRRKIDLGVLHAFDHDGHPSVRAFVNAASFGASGAVAELSPRNLAGVLGAVRALATFKNIEVRIRVDGTPFYEGRIFVAAIANGRYFANGLKIAPHADPSDGKLELVVLGDLSRRDLIALAPKIYSGAHLGEAFVSLGSGRVIEAEPLHAWATVPLDVDGEAPGRLPIRASVRAGALVVRG